MRPKKTTLSELTIGQKFNIVGRGERTHQLIRTQFCESLNTNIYIYISVVDGDWNTNHENDTTDCEVMLLR